MLGHDVGHFAVVNDPDDPNKRWEDKIPGMRAYTADQIAEVMEGRRLLRYLHQLR